jgi:CAAX protease family protein
MTVLGIVLDRFGSRFFGSLLQDTRLGGIPPITNPLVAQIDLYLGLVLVAVVEELIFRGLYFTILSRYFPSRIVVFGISALTFGLIHWSLGLNAIIHTALVGAVLMICIWKTGSALPTAAHAFRAFFRELCRIFWCADQAMTGPNRVERHRKVGWGLGHGP